MIIIQEYFIYIITNKNNRVLYIGMTNSLPKRMHQHKTGKFDNSFTKKYQVYKLIYFEKLNNRHKAAKREKQIKGWSRSKKIKLIKLLNPNLKDLSQKWFITWDPSAGSG